ncbi:MAG: DoxX family protein [Flavobacterium sp.]|jgi:hypothetical protein|nr:DoxX family protein [Flavobacterium sp.]
MKKTQISLLLRIIIAVIFLQTLYFKFTAHPDSVHIFQSLGIEPYGRIGLGIIELITSFLIFIPRTKIIGVFLSLGIISGAIFSHFLVIGTNVEGDGGKLFLLAIVVFLSAISLIILYKNEVISLINIVLRKKI